MSKTADEGRLTAGEEASGDGCVPTDREGNAEACGTGAKVVSAFRYDYVSEGPFVNMHI